MEERLRKSNKEQIQNMRKKSEDSKLDAERRESSVSESSDKGSIESPDNTGYSSQINASKVSSKYAKE